MSIDVETDPSELLRRAAKEERRLLRREQEAERSLLAAAERLARAELRLAKAQARVDRRRASVAGATAELRRRQDARATGPDGWLPAAVSALPVAAEPAPPPTRDDETPLPPPDATPTSADAVLPVADSAPRRRATRRKPASSETPT